MSRKKGLTSARICSPKRVYGKFVARITITVIRKVTRLTVSQKDKKSVLLKLRYNRHCLNI